MISLQKVTKRFGGTTVVSETTLHAERGRNTVLIGPSGCGKSTLIRMMIGLIQPDSGTVTVGGDALDYAHLGDLRQRMGYVIQSGGLFPHLTARDNVVLMARRLGWERVRVEARLVDLADLTRFP